MTAIGPHKISREQCAIGLRAAAKILKLWQASNDQACRVLRVSRATYRSVFGQESRSAIRLDADQMQRIGIVLNMHSTLRTVFDNPENVYGYAAMANQKRLFLWSISTGDHGSGRHDFAVRDVEANSGSYGSVVQYAYVGSARFAMATLLWCKGELAYQKVSSSASGLAQATTQKHSTS